jgi:hypothetical protein
MIARPHNIDKNNNNKMIARSLLHLDGDPYRPLFRKSDHTCTCTSSLTETRNSALVEDSHCSLSLNNQPICLSVARMRQCPFRSKRWFRTLKTMVSSSPSPPPGFQPASTTDRPDRPDRGDGNNNRTSNRYFNWKLNLLRKVTLSELQSGDWRHPSNLLEMTFS